MPEFVGNPSPRPQPDFIDYGYITTSFFMNYFRCYQPLFGIYMFQRLRSWLVVVSDSSVHNPIWVLPLRWIYFICDRDDEAFYIEEEGVEDYDFPTIDDGFFLPPTSPRNSELFLPHTTRQVRHQNRPRPTPSIVQARKSLAMLACKCCKTTRMSLRP